MSLLGGQFSRLRQVWEQDIWLASGKDQNYLRGRFFALLRIISITVYGLHDLKVAARAAALSYSSLLGLGPLVALTVLISGFALGNRDPAVVAEGLGNIIGIIAPQVSLHEPASKAAPADQPAGTARAAAKPTVDPDLVHLIETFIASSRSGTAGVVGILVLLFIVLQLFTTVENTFNDIWGVRRGRSWLTRVVYYWATVTLGALLFFASITLLSAGALANVFRPILDRLPFGEGFASLLAWLLPSSSLLVLLGLLTLFYRLIPNTRVRWRAALIGAVIVTLLLFLNNYLAFLYFRGVVRTKSLYGSVALPIVLMAGLYVFWFIVLVGGQITYAVQNVRYRSSKTAWHSLNVATRESLSLLMLLLIARRFKECLPAYSTTELAHRIRVPSQILNESLNSLSDLGLIAQLPSVEPGDQSNYRYQPARPLGSITLVEFRQLFENHGEAPSGEMLDDIDPILAHYHERIEALLPQVFGDQSLEALIDRFEPSRTTAPFPVAAPPEEA